MDLETQKQPVPWAKKKEIGFFNALWKTIKQVLFQPGDFFENLEIKGSYSEPFLFYFIVVTSATTISFLLQVFLYKKSPSQLLLFITFLLIVLGLYIGSALLHLCVLLFGGKGGFKGTFNVLAYKAATSIFSIIPVIGMFIAGAWDIVVGVIGFKRIHKLNTVRAVFAYFGFPIVIVPMILALLAAIAIPNLLRARIVANESAALATVRTIATAMETFQSVNNRYPMDELELKYANPPYLEKTYNNQTLAGYNYSVNLNVKEGYVITAKPSTCYETGVKIFKISRGGELSQEDCRK